MLRQLNTLYKASNNYINIFYKTLVKNIIMKILRCVGALGEISYIIFFVEKVNNFESAVEL